MLKGEKIILMLTSMRGFFGGGDGGNFHIKVVIFFLTYFNWKLLISIILFVDSTDIADTEIM